MIFEMRNLSRDRNPDILSLKISLNPRDIKKHLFAFTFELRVAMLGE